MQYRQGRLDDALCVGVLAMQVFLETYATVGIRPDLAREALATYTPEAFSGRLEHPGAHFILAERGGHLLAFAELVLGGAAPDPSLDRGAELVRLYVQGRFKRMGIGRELLGRAEAWAAGRNAASVWLTAWTGNAEAAAFYESQGYKYVGITQYVFEGRAYDNRIYRRGLGDIPSPTHA